VKPYILSSTSKTSHSSFGSVMIGREFEADTAGNYRFGFNGKEKDDETYGEGNEYDYGFRIYNPNLGKFLSVDPLTVNYPWYTPYQFAGNMPINCIDIDGLEEYRIITWWSADKGKYRSKISLIDASAPYEVTYVMRTFKDVPSSDIPTQGTYDNIIIGERTSENFWHNDKKQKRADQALIDKSSGAKYTGSNFDEPEGFSPDLPKDKPNPPATITPSAPSTPMFNGTPIKPGAKIDYPSFPYCVATTPLITGAGDKMQPGDLSKEAKKYYKELGSKIKDGNIKVVNITVNGFVGTMVNDSQFGNFKNSVETVAKNIEKELRKAGVSKDIKINVIPNAQKSDTDMSNTVIKLN